MAKKKKKTTKKKAGKGKVAKKSLTKVTRYKNIVIVYRPDTKEAIKLSSDLSNWLKDHNIVVYSHPDQKLATAKKLTTNKLSSVDLVIVLGGDGTYLEAVRMLQGKKIPILGVNMGSLGFLTETKVEDLYSAVLMTLEGKMEMRPRSMLSIKVKRAGKLKLSLNALNDIVIERGSHSHIINLGIYSENHHVSDVKADGVVIASPTGSTAYNLAAGGPILHPQVNVFVVTPICPHALTNRPIIFPEGHDLAFRLNNPLQKAALTVDGQSVCELGSNDEVIIRKANCDHFVLRKPSHNYFDLLREKLKFGARA